MSKRSRDGVNIPGMLLDQIKNTESFDNDDRFNFKKRKGGKQVSRKEKRKNERQLKKQKKSIPIVDSRFQSNGPQRQNNHQQQQQQKLQKPQQQNQSKNNSHINNHNVSNSFDKHTTAMNTKLNKTVPSQFVEDPNKFKKSKKSKSVQFSEKNQIRSIENRASLKYNDSGSSDDDMYYDFEKDFFDDEADEDDDEDDELDEDDDEEPKGDYYEDEDEKRTWEALMQLKKGKSTNDSTEIRTVKEDEISDDEISEDELLASESESDSGSENNEDNDIDNNDDDEDDEESKIWAALKKLKAAKNSDKKEEIRVVKEDDLQDDSLSDDFSEDDDRDVLDDDDNESEEEDEEMLGSDEDENKTWEALKKLKSMKKDTKPKSEVRIIREDEIDDDSLSEDEDLSGSEEISESSESSAGEDDEEEEDMDETKVWEQLKKLKGNKKANDTGSDIKIVKEDDLDDDSLSEDFSEEEEEEEEKKIKQKKESKKEKSKKSKKESEEEEEYAPRPLSASEREAREHDRSDMDYYAKKLGIKNKKLSKTDDDDLVGGLLDGLDFLFDGEGSDNYDNYDNFEETTKKEPKKSKKQQKEEVYSDDDDEEEDQYGFGENDFEDDDDLDEDDKALLREMQQLGDSEDSDEGSDSEDDGRPRVRENPYAAPVASPANKTEDVSGSRYIPPALRRKMALEQGSQKESEEVIKLTKSIKGPLNRLSEANIITIVNDINLLYSENARQTVNETIIKVILQSVLVPGPQLDSLLVLYASVISAIYTLQGTEFGAYTIQTFVEKLNEYLKDENLAKGRELINLIGLLGHCYNLKVVGCTLIYDIVSKKLVNDPTELKTDALLKLIKTSGPNMRSDDPSSLKQIISDLNKSISEEEKKTGKKANARTRFLVDTITNLKNNKLKNIESENTTQMLTRIRKLLARIKGTKSFDAIKVTLDDIEKIEERGKWWLVGSAWKGLGDNKNDDNDNGNLSESLQESDIYGKVEVNDSVINDVLDSAEPNWLELARLQRMNTDIRRAIFVSIMSANDFMDAFGKLEKLRLKKQQEREIPNILMHCASMESVYNPYYGMLAKKICEEHSMRKTFQFNLWDLLKDFEGGEDDDEKLTLDTSSGHINDEETKLKKVLNLGRLFGFLIGEGSLPLNILRTVNFLTASSDTKLFMEILLITFFDSIGKHSEIKSFGSGLKSKNSIKDMRFDEKLLMERIAKTKEQHLLLKGLQYFLQDSVKSSNLIKGKKQRKRVDWGTDAMCDIIDGIIGTQS
ncbi:hypothetical protein B5S28_g845 [[Candida] boidinii]|nr:hypothetical protein B5S28_g845 [[Candida] boidinii]OWB61170.1 hypothetical protein B5S29_g2055 [[Candida] boidinii]